MESKDKNRFYLLWTLAIFLCAALAVFLLFYASFTEPDDSAPKATPYTDNETL